jgi:hypothetical protein
MVLRLSVSVGEQQRKRLVFSYIGHAEKGPKGDKNSRFLAIERYGMTNGECAAGQRAAALRLGEEFVFVDHRSYSHLPGGETFFGADDAALAADMDAIGCCDFGGECQREFEIRSGGGRSVEEEADASGADIDAPGVGWAFRVVFAVLAVDTVRKTYSQGQIQSESAA